MEKRICLVLKASGSVCKIISVGEKTPIMLKRAGSLRQVRHVRPNMRIELDTQVIWDVSDPIMCCLIKCAVSLPDESLHHKSLYT